MSTRYSVTIITFLAITIAGVYTSCTRDIAGAGSETTNGITGSVYNGDGSAASASVVKLISTGFNADGNETLPDSLVDTTDNAGGYRFRNVAAGAYNIIMRNTTSKTGCTIDSVEFKAGDTLVVVADGTLAPTAALILRTEGILNHETSTLFIPGSDVTVKINDDPEVVIDNIPAGVSGPLYIVNESETPVLIAPSITLTAGDTTRIVQPGWQFSHTITLNTGASGIATEEILYNFPALLRLNSNNFPFNEAQPDGSDLRITRPDGSPISFEIELWDRSAETAVIWARIDTLENNTTQDILMHWGNRSVTTNALSAAVFDTAASFEGVWHLGSTSDTAADATVNGYDGLCRNFTKDKLAEGIIGNACRFNGAEYIEMPATANSMLSFPQNGSYTISVWAYADTVDGESRALVSKGNYQYFLWYTSIHTGLPNWEFTEYQSGEGWDLSGAEAAEKEWHLITGVRKGSSQYLYIDGVLSDSTGFSYPATATGNTGHNLVIGRLLQEISAGDYCYFKGSIDEVRISSTARSSAWIRASYLNQKQNELLVNF